MKSQKIISLVLLILMEKSVKVNGFIIKINQTMVIAKIVLKNKINRVLKQISSTINFLTVKELANKHV